MSKINIPTVDNSDIRLDLNGFHSNLRREGTPDRVYFFEHGVAENMQEALHDRYGIWNHIDHGSPTASWDKSIATHRFLGHEYFPVYPAGARLKAPRKAGDWTNEGKGLITTREEFRAFEWPDANRADLSVLEYYDKVLPADMRVFHVVDLWEVVRDMMGFETICFAIYEQPELVEAIFDRVGDFLMKVLDRCLRYRCYGAVYLADDLGYKTSLMISPEHIRQFVLPWHKRIADLAHQHNKFYFFHSCGNIYSIIDDFIVDVGIDAKHSFENNVMPVEEVKRQFGKRMTLLGGMDVDLLARADPETIRQKTLQVLETCHPGGGFFLGAGNWITNYIPVDNYLAMLRAGREFL